MTAQRRYLSTSAELSIERLWDIFAEAEAREKLTSWRIGSIYLWPLVRASLMHAIAEQLGIFEPRPPNAPIPDTVVAPGLMPGSVGFHQSDYAVVPFIRRNAFREDPFSNFIVKSLEAHGVPPMVIGFGPDDIGSGRPQLEQLDREFVARYGKWAKLMVAPTLLPGHIAKYNRMIAYVTASVRDYAVSIGLNPAEIGGAYRAFPRWLLVQFAAQKMGWKRFFKAAGTKKVFMVNAWKRALIAGAQAAGATVVEPMHGAISDIHPYLSWPGQARVAYHPDELLEWGAYWGDVAKLPGNVTRKVIGSPVQITDALARLDDLAASGEAHKPKTVFIASQVHASQTIIDFLIEAAAANPDYTFTFKQHPQENPIKFGPEIPANLQLAGPNTNTFDLMSRSEFVLGVYTTALFEAVALGAKVGVLAFSGWHHIRGLVERGDATLINNQADLGKFFTSSAPACSPSSVAYYYAPPVTAEELWAAIKIDE